jgi:hypothetical protein
VKEETWTETIKGDDPYRHEGIGEEINYDSIRREFIKTGKVTKET